MTATEYRITAGATLATLLTSLTLVPLIKSPTWLVTMAVMVLTIAAAGVAGRLVLPWRPAVLAVQVAAGVLGLTSLFVRDTAVALVLPGPAAWGAFDDLLTAGLTVTREQTPPVPSGRGVVLLATLGITLVALVVDAVAVGLRKPAVAGLPLLAVYCVPAAVLPGGLDWWWFSLAAAGFLLLVGSDAVDRVRQWGRVLGPAGDDTGERSLGGPLPGGRRLVAGSLLAAVLVPAAIPGLDAKLFGDRSDAPGTGHGGNISVINPILRIRESLNQPQDVVLLRYTTTTPDPEPLRIVTDDAFDGEKWAPTVGKIPRSNRVQNGLPNAPGLSPSVPTTPQQTEISTLDLVQTYLPLPYPTTKVEIDGPWLFDATNLNVVGDYIGDRQAKAQNLRYQAYHLTVTPSVEQLKAAPTPPADILATYTKLPATTPSPIRTTARKVAGTGTPYQQAMALQQWFRSGGGFRYSRTVLPPTGKDASSQDAIVTFLRNKQGYCVQFASSMAVMARTLKIPSRVGVGFLPGERKPDGSWEISAHDAHAWPELYFAGVGWVRFEPTPGIRSGSAPEWALPPNSRPEAPASTPSASSAPAPVQVPPQVIPQSPEQKVIEHQPPLWKRILGAVPWRLMGILVLLLVVVAVPLTVSRARRRMRWQRVAHQPPVDRVEAAWEELRERLEDLGVTWPASWTPRALRSRLIADHELGEAERAALGRLVTDVEQARYAPPGAPVRDTAELRADVDTVVASVTQSAVVSDWSRHRARWLPTAGLRAMLGVGGTSADPWDSAASGALGAVEARPADGGPADADPPHRHPAGSGSSTSAR